MDAHPVVTSFPFVLSAARKKFPFEVFIPRHDEPEHIAIELQYAAHRLLNVDCVYEVQTGGTIKETHAFIGEKATTEMVLVLDADLELGEGPFKMFPTELFGNETEYTHLWHVRNPINGLEYGHGGPKLFNRKVLQTANRLDAVDMTTGLDASLCLHTECVGVHKFNWSDFSTWRTAIREAAKLAVVSSTSNDDLEKQEAEERLNVWTTVADEEAPFSEYCIEGAVLGKKMAREKLDDIRWVNDYEFLERMFRELHPLY